MRKTKEQILKEQKSVGDGDYCLKAMEQYAKEEAIDFKNWCDDNGWQINYLEQHTHTTKELYKIFTTEKLYDTFINQKSNDERK